MNSSSRRWPVSLITRASTLLIMSIMLFMTACGGGDDEPPPPHVPTEQEAEALKKFNQAAQDFNRTLLGGGSVETSHKDQFMNALLLYLTSDGGRKSDESIAYLVWYVKNVVKSSIPMYASNVKAVQQNALYQLGRLYRSILSENNNPAVANAINMGASMTGFPNYLNGSIY